MVEIATPQASAISRKSTQTSLNLQSLGNGNRMHWAIFLLGVLKYLMEHPIGSSLPRRYPWLAMLANLGIPRSKYEAEVEL